MRSTSTPSASASSPAPTHNGRSTLEPGEWDRLTYRQRSHFMKEVVLPRMGQLFDSFDPSAFAKVECATCHGKGAADGSFKMPSSDLPPLPNNPAGFQALLKDKPRWMEFMSKEVRPEMAAMLGKPVVDMRHPMPDQFGCRNCHVIPER